MPITITQHGGLLQANGLYLASIIVQNGGKNIQMDQHFWVNPAGFAAGPTLGDLAFTVQSAVDASLQGICTIETDFVGTQVHQVLPALNKALAGIASSTSIGSVANPTADRTSGLVITKTTLVSGRSGRGRMYLPPTGVSDVTNFGKPSAGYITRATTFYTDIFGIGAVTAGAGAATALVSIYNRKAATFLVQTSFLVRNIFGTQRRRGYYKVARHKKKA